MNEKHLAVPQDDSLEGTKFALELERLKLERFKIWLTAISIVVPVILGIITVIYNVWSENERTKATFEIKAIEVVMSADSPTSATNKAVVLHELFPNRLPKNFKDKMIELYGNTGSPGN